MLPVGYEPEITNVIERFAEPGDCVIDAGASIGFHTCFMSKLVGESGLVLAFEPQLESYKHLLQHVHVANKLNNVACLRTALWKFDCPELELWSMSEIGYSSFHRLCRGDLIRKKLKVVRWTVCLRVKTIRD